jgi:hypothetical protein
MSKPTLAERVIVYTAGDIEAYRRLLARRTGLGCEAEFKRAVYAVGGTSRHRLPPPVRVRPRSSQNRCFRSMWRGGESSIIVE